jgi:hypothetical protein
MGLAYFHLPNDTFQTLATLIAQHEADAVGPRARGYWFDQSEAYDYESGQSVARLLFAAGEQTSSNLTDWLELSENEAHSLSMLELEMPADDQPISPSLFLHSADPIRVRQQLKIARRKLGSTPEVALRRIGAPQRDPRFAGYMQKQVRHLKEALPKVWHFYEAAAEADQAVLVVDLRARDLEIPEAFELSAY